MVEIVDNKWRAFIKLQGIDGEDVYFDVTKRPTMSEHNGKTAIYLGDEGIFFVKDSVADIIAAVESMIDAQAEQRKLEQQKLIEQFENKE